MIYKHTQMGIVILVVLAIAGLIIFVTARNTSPIILFSSLAFLLVIALLFGSLTIQVNAQTLQCWFGVGLIRREIPLANIVAVKVVKNHWYYGWGIRLTPHGWMFNVSGLDAVQLEFTSGKKFRLGTDEPQKLEAIIAQKINNS